MENKIYGFTADGASVNGVRRAMSNLGGDNLADRIETAMERKILVVHCAPHRLQLVFKNSWLDDEYLLAIDDVLHELHNHLKNSVRAHHNLICWAHVAGDDQFIKDLNMGKARWLN